MVIYMVNDKTVNIPNNICDAVSTNGICCSFRLIPVEWACEQCNCADDRSYTGLTLGVETNGMT